MRRTRTASACAATCASRVASGDALAAAAAAACSPPAPSRQCRRLHTVPGRQIHLCKTPFQTMTLVEKIDVLCLPSESQIWSWPSLKSSTPADGLDAVEQRRKRGRRCHRGRQARLGLQDVAQRLHSLAHVRPLRPQLLRCIFYIVCTTAARCESSYRLKQHFQATQVRAAAVIVDRAHLLVLWQRW